MGGAALPPPSTFRQDLPPPGGFPKPPTFPAEGWRKRSPVRGPPGYIAIGLVLGTMGFSLYRLLGDIEERNYYNLSKLNERFERAYVLQAKEQVRWLRREKECLDNERELMKDVPGWVVGKRRYMTQFEDRPDRDVLDPRKPGSIW